MKHFTLSIVVLMLLATTAYADDDTTPANDLDSIESLLEGLPDDSTSKPKEPVEQPTRQPGEDIGVAPADGSLAGIGRQMEQVKSRIDSGDTADETQFMQKQIVSDLDALLDILNKKCQGGQCKNPSSKPSAKPGSKPKAGSNPGGKSNNPDAQKSEEGIRKGEEATESDADPNTVVRQAWGHLPERLREQVQAAAFERFLPEYESLIEAYYERLAEEGE